MNFFSKKNEFLMQILRAVGKLGLEVKEVAEKTKSAKVVHSFLPLFSAMSVSKKA